MITWEQAHAIAAERVAGLYVEGGDRAVLVDDLTTAYEFGWLFEFQSEAFLRTGDERWRLYDNHPFVVHRSDGHVVPIPRRHGDRLLGELEAAWRAGGAPSGG